VVTKQATLDTDLTLTPVRSPTAPETGVTLAIMYAFVLLVIPSDVVIVEVGAAAFPAGLLGMFGFGLWVGASLLGLHDPSGRSSPARVAVGFLWLATLAGYVALAMNMPAQDAVNSADRWIMQAIGWTGIALVTAESVETRRDLRSIIRSLGLGISVAGGVAIIQYFLSFDLAKYLRMLPGFGLSWDNTGIHDREGLNRVAGTSTNPIEMGIVAASLLPLMVVSAIFDNHRPKILRWGPVALTAIIIPLTVSRSAILGTAVSMTVLALCLRPRHRAWILAAIPAAALAAYLSVPDLVRTIERYFFLGSSDSSIAAREHDVPMVESLVAQRPWWGRGGGSYMAHTQLDILDNQLYKFLIEFGLIGTALIVLGYICYPVLAALSARRRCDDHEMSALGGGLAGATAVGLVALVSFDSMSFGMYAGLFALLVGIVGAYWRLARSNESGALVTVDRPPDVDHSSTASIDERLR